MMICTRYKGTEFLNLHQIDVGVNTEDTEAALSWIEHTAVHFGYFSSIMLSSPRETCDCS